MKDTFFSKDYSMNCEGKLIDLSTPKVMGILNLTPDSFFDGGKNKEVSKAIQHTEQMLKDGATYIDIGGYSSRPGATNISIEEEIFRTSPVIEALKREFPEVLISIDTFRSEVAQQALDSGACMVNDISGGKLDLKMYDIVAEKQVPYIAMHMRGTPQNMQQDPHYKDVALEVSKELSEITTQLKLKGCKDVVLDPGFGFSKTLEQNYQLMNNLEHLQILKHPILVGISRKSMLYKMLETSAEEALNGTTSLNTIALLKGANILRVHDVKEAIEVVKITEMMKG